MTLDSSPASKELLVKALRELKAMREQLAALRQAKHEPIAIVGMACRFPGGADTPERYWELLSQGVNAVREVPADRWDADAFYDADPEAAGKMYTRLGGFLENVDTFDPVFFGIAPREAANMDPQQRLLLEVAWEALENAGLPVATLANSRTGVFVGLASSDYSHLLAEAGSLEEVDAYVLTGNAPNVSAGRLAYVLGLQGPAMAVDTACSSSLVSVHLACQSLRDRECDAALAAGVNLILSPVSSIAFCRMNAIARDGYCKTFDAAADGFIRGEGCGVVVLKRLSDALAAGDTIQALVRGSAVNQDGHTSALTVPNGPAQQAVIRAALERAGVAPQAVRYVEAHGTGTPLGDPIELQALAEAYDRVVPSEASTSNAQPAPLYVGSVKTNFGHLEGAAGIAGLIKAVLALQHRAIPPHLHFHRPNPRLDWARLALRIPTALTDWQPGDSPRLAAVSAFGFSGTNAHLILEESPQLVSQDPAAAVAASQGLYPASVQLFLLSARSQEQLAALAGRMLALLKQSDASIEAICRSSQTRRSHWNWRLAVTVDTVEELKEKLRAYLDNEPAADLYAGTSRPHGDPRVAFLYSGQGGQQVGMGVELYRTQPVFRQTFDRCGRAAAAYLDRPLADICFNASQVGAPFDHIIPSQLALFSFQVALASLWQSWGVEPAVVLGHSLGEYAAAVVAGVLSLEDALTLVGERVRLMDAQGVQGGVGVVLVDLDELQPYLDRYQGQVWSVGHSGPKSVTLAGYADAIAALLQEAEGAGMQVRALLGFGGAGFPIHTPLMDPVVAGLAPFLNRTRRQRPSLAFISSYTGDRVDAELLSTDYWVAQSRRPFDMARATQTLVAERTAFVVEIGPNTATSAMARRCAPDAPLAWLPSLREGQGDVRRMYESLAQLHVGGVDVNWQAVAGERRYPPVRLPLTPFIRRRYWFATSERKVALSHLFAGDAGAGWLGQPVPSPLDASLFSTVLEPGSFAFLPDHQVHGTVVVAAGAHLARAIAAAQETSGSGPCLLEEIAFTQPLILQTEQPRLVQLVWQPEGAGRARVRIASAPAGETRPGWTDHMTGYAARAHTGTAVAASFDLNELQAQCPRTVDPAAFYEELAGRGYNFGPTFRWIEAIQRGDGRALCRLRAPIAVDDVPGSPVPPGLLDACLQSLSATVDTAGLPVYVPYSVDQLHFYRTPEGASWCHAIAHDTHSGGKMVAGDMRLYDQAGNLLLEVVGLHGRQISAEELRHALQAATSVSDLYFHVQWPEVPLAAPAGAAASGLWLLFADAAGVAAALAERLGAHDRPVVWVHPGDSFRRSGAGEWEIRPAEAGDYRRLLAEVAESFGAAQVHILHLWSLDTGDMDPLAAQRHGGDSLILLAQAIAGQAGTWPRLRCITAGAAPGFVTNAPGTAWAAATLWGLGPTIAAELPELWAGLIDIDVHDPAAADALWTELLAPSAEQRTVLRNSRRLVARLVAGVPTSRNGTVPQPSILANRPQKSVIPQSSPAIVPDATYLIAGGTGALGLAVAGWLVARGARHLALLGRHGPNETAVTRIAALAESGAEVAVKTADVTRPEQLEQVLAEMRAHMPPLRGVFHLAGVLEDATLAKLTLDQYRRVLAPKLAGAWNLHRLTLADSLDYFVLFSSAAALLGPPGQAAYAAANAALDALAQYRRAAGRPALALNWGPWQGDGMASDAAVGPWHRWGIVPLLPEQALRALEQALSLPLSQVAVIAWQPAARQSQRGGPAGSPFLARLFPAPPAGDAEVASALREQLAQAPAGRRRALLLDALQREAVRILGLPPGTAFDPQQSLNEYGLDSLMAVELRNAIVRLAGHSLPVTLLFDYPTLEATAVYLLDEVFHFEVEAPLTDAAAGVSDLESRIAALSEDEAEAMLAENLAALRIRERE